MRKPSRDVSLDDIIAGQILGEDGNVVALVMKIHLALEALMIEMIQCRDASNAVYRLSFPAKAQRLADEGLVTEGDKQAFLTFNDFRNDFAHIFGHEIGLSDTLALARKLEDSGVDFSDSVGRYTEAQAESYYGGLYGVLEEIGWCVLFHAAFLLSEAGGRNIFGT